MARRALPAAALTLLLFALAVDHVEGQVHSVTKTQYTSVGGEIGKAAKQFLGGFVLVIIAYPLLWFNERRQAKMWALFGRAEKIAKPDVPSDKVVDENEARLVHVVGTTATNEVLRDEDFKTEVRNCARLEREVEMYQWKESEQETTRDTAMGGTETTTTYTYSLVWSSDAIDSSSFAQTAGHENPPMPLTSLKHRADHVTLGAFELPPRLADKMCNAQPLVGQELPPDAPAPKSGVGRKFKLVGGVYTTVEEGAVPQVGDMQVTFKKVPCGDCTVLAVQTAKSFAPLTCKMKTSSDRVVCEDEGASANEATAAMLDKATKGDDVDLEKGAGGCCFVCNVVGALVEANEEVFELLEERATLQQVIQVANAREKTQNTMLRIVGFVLFLVGHYLMFAFVPSLFRVIPLIGSWIHIFGKFLAAIASLLVSGVTWSLTVAIAWLSMRPLQATLLLLGAVLLFAIPTIVSKMF